MYTNRKFSFKLAAILSASVSLIAFMSNLNAGETNSTTKVKYELTPELGRVTPAQSWLGRKVKSADGEVVGTIEDLELDLDTGRVAIVIVHSDDKPDEARRVAVPASLIVPVTGNRDGSTAFETKMSNVAFEASPALATGDDATSFTRQLALELYKHFREIPYWKDVVGNASDEDVFVRLSHVKKQVVKQQDGSMLGHIADFAVVPETGTIGYVVLSVTDNRKTALYPIPLGAFVVNPKENTWTLDLPEGLLDNTPAMADGQWPTEVFRGWTEFVHVKYGGGELAGVQRTSK